MVEQIPSATVMLSPGDPIFHPRYGFGTIQGLTRRDPAYPMRDTATGDSASGQEQDYYDIQLLESGTLLVPVSRAASVGLRLLTNGVATVTTRLTSAPQSLPDDYRQRAAILRERARCCEPTALADSVRDMLAQSRGRHLSAGEKTWLDNSCELLSVEASLVDNIGRSEARAAIWEIVNRLNAP